MKDNRRKHKRHFLNEVSCLNNLLINFMTHTSLKTKPLNSSYFRFHPFVFYFEKKKKKSLCLLRFKFQNLVVPEYHAHQIFTCALSPCYPYKEAVVQRLVSAEMFLEGRESTRPNSPGHRLFGGERRRRVCQRTIFEFGANYGDSP